MKSIQPPDSHHLSSACGWVELGNAAEAKLDIKKIDPSLQNHPDVLEVCYSIHSEEKNWHSAAVVARTLTQIAPGRVFGWTHLAFALHELKRTQESSDLIKSVLGKFPKNWLLRYNLACYECQLGNEVEAIKLLDQAYKLGNRDQIKQMALEDTDLKPLWTKIAQ
jgi:hypothetical protein